MPSDRHASSARRGHPQAISGAPPAIAGALCRVMYRPLRGTARHTSRQVHKPNITHLQAPLLQAHGLRQNKPRWIIRQVVGKPAERSLRSWSRCGARHRRLRAKVCRPIGRPKCDGGCRMRDCPEQRCAPEWPHGRLFVTVERVEWDRAAPSRAQTCSPKARSTASRSLALSAPNTAID
jgi:hypothetical protein